MGTTTTITLYAVLVALLGFALASIAIWSRRELRMRLFAVVLAIVAAPVFWFAFSQLPGKPDSISAEEFREHYRCARITPVKIIERVGIFILAEKIRTKEPEYLFVHWNMRLASSLQKSMRVAKLNGSGSIIYGSASCQNDDEEGDGNGKGKKKNGKKGKPRMQQPGSSGQEQDGGDGFTFYPDPVPPMPEKNYGPLYEGPITMPER